MNYVVLAMSASFWAFLLYMIFTSDNEPKPHPKLDKIMNVMIYPIHIITQLIIWGWLIWLITEYDLNFWEVMFYFFSGGILSIALLAFAIIPNVMFIIDIFYKEEPEDDEVKIGH